MCRLCKDGGTAMLCHSTRFQAQVKIVIPGCTFMHCTLHSEALTLKKLSIETIKVLKS